MADINLSVNYLEENQGAVLKAMCHSAKEIGVEKGVAAIAAVRDSDHPNPVYYPQIAYQVVNDIFYRDPDPSKGKDDVGVNYLAVCCSKIAQMMVTHVDSGKQPSPPKIGEMPYRGGLAIRLIDGWLFIAFSGGSEDQDVEISMAGMHVFFLYQ